MYILKLRNLLLLFAITGLFTFSACSDDDESEPDPTLNFIGDTTTISPGGNTTVQSGEPVVFSWRASNGGSDLTRFTIDYVAPGGSSTQIFAKTNLADNNPTEYAGTFDTTLTQPGEHSFTFRIEEENGNSNERSITVTVEDNPQLESYTAVMVGAQNNTDFGSFYSVRQDSVYFASGFDGSNGEFIDFIYYYGATNDASIAAPSDATVEEFGSYSVTDFNQRNETIFLPIQDGPGNFNTATDLDQFRDALNNSEQTLANQLSTSDNFAFQLANGKIGVFGVQNLNNQGAGTITINVKVEP